MKMMEFNFQGLDICPEEVEDVNEMSAKLTFLLKNYYPDLVKAVVYEYDAERKTAKIIIRRDNKYYLTGDVIKADDCELITGLPGEFFVPKVFGGKDEGYFGLMPYMDSYYAGRDMIERFFKQMMAKSAVGRVLFLADDNSLGIRVSKMNKD